MVKKQVIRNIGLDIQPPKDTCKDNNCPFHGTLPVRGQILQGSVLSDKRPNTITVKREYMHYIRKYERYEKRTSIYSAHSPSCLHIKTGDMVRIAECRPLSKTISFVAVEKLQSK